MTPDDRLPAGWMNSLEIAWLREQAARANVTIEVGSYKGRSTLAMAEATKGTIYAVDHFAGSPGEDGNEESWKEGGDSVREQFLKNLAGHQNTVIQIWMKADRAAYYLKEYAGLKADFIFIDAAHDEKSVLEDIRNFVPLLKEGGVLAGHDADFTSVQAALNKCLPGWTEAVPHIWQWGGRYVEPGTEPRSKGKVERLVYVDNACFNDLGHHATSARLITKELRRRDVKCEVLAYKGVTEKLQQDLEAKPTFTHYTYGDHGEETNRASSWLTNFFSNVDKLVDDFMRAGADYLSGYLYWNSGGCAECLALAKILLWCPRARAVLEFGCDCGVDLQISEDSSVHGIPRNPLTDARSVLYSYCGDWIKDHPSVADRLTLATFDHGSSTMYCSLMGLPVKTLPLPRDAATLRCRAGARPITIGIIGHQRGEKGCFLVPEIVRQVLAVTHQLTRSIRFYLHDGNSETLKEWRELTERQNGENLFSSYDARVSLDTTCADMAYWQRILDRCDLIVCPYYPPRFMVSYSAVCAEAVANGIPIVVPSGTSLERMCQAYGGGTSFRDWDVASVVAAVKLAVENFPALAERAYERAHAWPSSQGTANFVDALLGVLQ